MRRSFLHKRFHLRFRPVVRFPAVIRIGKNKLSFRAVNASRILSQRLEIFHRLIRFVYLLQRFSAQVTGFGGYFGRQVGICQQSGCRTRCFVKTVQSILRANNSQLSNLLIALVSGRIGQSRIIGQRLIEISVVVLDCRNVNKRIVKVFSAVGIHHSSEMSRRLLFVAFSIGQNSQIVVGIGVIRTVGITLQVSLHGRFGFGFRAAHIHAFSRQIGK